MKKASLLLAVMGATAVALLVAGPGAAQLDEHGRAATTARSEPLAHELEATGTASTSVDGLITVTAVDGSSLTCAVPPALDLSSVGSGDVKIECELVNGVPTLRELNAENGAKVEVGDDEDEGEVEDDDAGEVDHSGPSANSGPGSANDDDGHSGPGGGDDHEDGHRGGSGGDDD